MVFFQPAELAFDDKTLSLLRLADILGKRRLGLCVMALVGEQPFAAFGWVGTQARWNADLVQQWLNVGDITGLVVPGRNA